MNNECVKKLQLLPTLFAGMRVHSNKIKLSKKIGWRGESSSTLSLALSYFGLIKLILDKFTYYELRYISKILLNYTVP